MPVCASVGDCESAAEPEAVPEPSPVQALARPKSSTFTFPSGVTFTFAGLRSRWTMPFSCASSRASAICRAIATASSTGTGPRFSRSARSSPSTSSMTSRWALLPSGSVACSKPYRWAIVEWLSEASSFASRSKRERRSGSVAKAAGRSFSATCRPSRVSVARQTSPIPPAPMAAVISYGPRRAPGARVSVEASSLSGNGVNCTAATATGRAVVVSRRPSRWPARGRPRASCRD